MWSPTSEVKPGCHLIIYLEFDEAQSKKAATANVNMYNKHVIVNSQSTIKNVTKPPEMT